MSRKVGAILLAAGASRRMGTTKALLPFPPDGTPLVAKVAGALTGGGASSLCVVVAPGGTGEAVAEAVPSAFAVFNPDPERGMLSSVQTGLRKLLSLADAPAAFLVCPCDLPRLEPLHVRIVVEAYEHGGGEILTPAFGGKRGHPTLFAASLADEILAMDPATEGLNALLRRRASGVREVGAPDDAVLRDADTPEEWRELTAG